MHPSLKIVAFLLLALANQFMAAAALALTAFALLALTLYLRVRLLQKLLYRSRWLLLTLLLIYAFTTPGEYVGWWQSDVAPTYEGIYHGLLQAGRLALMLAGLALLLGTTPRNALMAGIFQLLNPLRLLGIAPERFTARLWLTLHYVELDPPADDRRAIWSKLDHAASRDPAAEMECIRFVLPAFSRLDWLILGLLGMAMAWWLT